MDLAIKTFVHDPAEGSFSEIMGMKARFQWAEKILWDKVIKTTTGSYFKLSLKVGHTGQQLKGNVTVRISFIFHMKATG